MKFVKLVLVLQGGGVYGVFIWGVFNCLFEELWFIIIGISGVSVGVMNVVMVVEGW